MKILVLLEKIWPCMIFLNTFQFIFSKKITINNYKLINYRLNKRKPSFQLDSNPMDLSYKFQINICNIQNYHE